MVCFYKEVLFKGTWNWRENVVGWMRRDATACLVKPLVKLCWCMMGNGVSLQHSYKGLTHTYTCLNASRGILALRRIPVWHLCMLMLITHVQRIYRIQAHSYTHDIRRAFSGCNKPSGSQIGPLHVSGTKHGDLFERLVIVNLLANKR